MEFGKIIITRNSMAGSNTMLPNYIYTSNGSTLTANPSAAGITTQTIPINALQYQTLNANGHANLAGSTVFRPANKIIMPSGGNVVPILVNPINNITQLAQNSNQNVITNQVSHNIATLNGALVTRAVNTGLVTLNPNQSGEPRRKVFYVKLPPKTDQKIEPRTSTLSVASIPSQPGPLQIQPAPRRIQPPPMVQAPQLVHVPPVAPPKPISPIPEVVPVEEPETITIPDEPKDDSELVIDIMINNVVCSFAVGCHLDLRDIALSGTNVEYRRDNGMVTMKLRNPPTTASIWSSGKITCTGSTAADQAKKAARKVARSLQKLGYKVKFSNYRIVNVLGTCTMPFAIKISQFSQKHKKSASYEPELHPGVTYRIEHPKATLKIFSTGSITVTAPSVENVQNGIEHIFPLVKEFSKPRSVAEAVEAKKMQVINSEEESLSAISE